MKEPNWHDRYDDLEYEYSQLLKQREEWFTVMKQAREAFEFTRQYVGYHLLPALEGWSWYDADQALKTITEEQEGE